MSSPEIEKQKREQWNRELRQSMHSAIKKLAETDKQVQHDSDGWRAMLPYSLELRDNALEWLFMNLEDIDGCAYEGEYAVTPP